MERSLKTCTERQMCGIPHQISTVASPLRVVDDGAWVASKMSESDHVLDAISRSAGLLKVIAPLAR